MAVSEGGVDTLVLQLYRSAREVPFTRFQEHALEIIKPIMDFDTAIWGVGTSNGRGGFINSVHLHGLPPHMMDDYAGEVQSQDVAAERTSVQPGRTVSIPWDDPEMLTERRAVARAYLRKYRLTHLLCTALARSGAGSVPLPHRVPLRSRAAMDRKLPPVQGAAVSPFDRGLCAGALPAPGTARRRGTRSCHRRSQLATRESHPGFPATDVA